MAQSETIQTAFRLSTRQAETIAGHMEYGEEALTDIGHNSLEWLKQKAQEEGRRLLAITLHEKTLRLYVLIGDGVGHVDFQFKGGDPVRALWRSIVSGQFNDSLQQADLFPDHLPN